MARISLACLLALGGAILPSSEAGGKVFLSKEEALAVAFPDATEVASRTVVLDDQQARDIERAARRKLESRLVTIHTGLRESEILGYAFIELQTVRTLPQALLVVLTPTGRVRTLRMIAFYEPREYLPAVRWLKKFDDAVLLPELRLGGRIHGIAGSTLSSRAVTGSVRRVLAYHRVLLRGDVPEDQDQTPDNAAGVAPVAGGR